MGILKTLSIPFEESVLPVSLTASNSVKPRYTAVIGPNGSRKSYMLRELVSTSLKLMRSSDAEKLLVTSRKGRAYARVPDRVIAVSAVPTDRFPTKRASTGLTSAAIYDDQRYIYVGPRTAQNLVSRHHSAKELVFQILSNPTRFSSKRIYASNLMKKVGVPQGFKFGLDVRKAKALLGTLAPPTVQAFLQARAIPGRPASSLASNFINALAQHDVEHYYQEINTQLASSGDQTSSKQSPFEVYVDIKNGQIAPG